MTTAPTKAAASITYEVDSDAALSTVTYFDGMNDEKQITNVGAPWSLSFDNQATFPIIGLGAQTTGLHVSCQISVNGQVRDQKTATGRYAVVNCNASA
ncbi:MmpS family transport accessory protein [Mycobacterium sp. E3198]|uniref:MmpS family transport accessory protein n=1 Tax=Mycobacterium sp. E3198 TaxID=1834143 RepID=UPI001E592C7E|nr:MmpS family transport accessory protein [Mycobacterium sp. E3198]